MYLSGDDNSQFEIGLWEEVMSLWGRERKEEWRRKSKKWRQSEENMKVKDKKKRGMGRKDMFMEKRREERQVYSEIISAPLE